MTKNLRGPQAFIIEEKPHPKKLKPEITFEAEPPVHEIVHVPHAVLPARGTRWGSIFIGATFTFFSLWAGLTITKMIESFFQSSPFLGWVALSIASLAGLAALAIVFREIYGLARLRRIEKIQLMAAHALNQDDASSAMQTVAALTSLYKAKADSAWNLKNYETHANDIIDPRDRVRLIERFLVDPLDENAHRIIARRARRVTLLTTVTPAAALDVLFVAAQNLAMMREIATLYGGRPSTLATFKLARMVITHLAIAGGMALSENFLHLFVGKGILGRLSARFGEGAVNGILTARIGLAACEVCRPIPQDVTKRETLASLMKELTTFGSTGKSE